MIEKFPLSYGYEDIAIRQKKNICDSRLSVDTKSEIINGVFRTTPLIASNMSTVIDADFYIKIYKLGAFAFLHRAQEESTYLAEAKTIAKECQWAAASIGVGESQYELAKKLVFAGINVLLIDVAHGYADSVISLGRKLKRQFPHIKMVVGNTTNLDMISEVFDFADAVKVGVGQGFACETKNTAGCTEKQFSAVYSFHDVYRELGLPIIGDGAIREPADLVKCIAAGANSAMAGSIFAACCDSPAPEIWDNTTRTFRKVYAGMASEYVQNSWKGGLKAGTCAEGGVRYLTRGQSVEKLLERYLGALRTGIPYGGGNDIVSFQKIVEFVRFK